MKAIFADVHEGTRVRLAAIGETLVATKNGCLLESAQGELHARARFEAKL